MTLPVYYDPYVTDAEVGSTHILTGAEAHHAATVRRTSVGDLIDIVDGEGVRATIEVTRVDKDAVSGSVRSRQKEAPPSPHITLVQALAKGGRDEQAIETATEYGVDAVIPWAADRAVVKWNDRAKIARNSERWQATCIAAAKQSRRSWIPEVRELCDTRELVQRVEEVCAHGGQVLICHENATQRLVDIPLDSPEMYLIVGPEGGITDTEID
ncbi:MAG: 16S rRNA (uracil(1498)-N(3))-methyltransferase [Arcanobacterium sp.]|nr:16S rRNA (uracil(1498)-N(3))-methyltransferase [Arcanobacterium sp.]